MMGLRGVLGGWSEHLTYAMVTPMVNEGENNAKPLCQKILSQALIH